MFSFIQVDAQASKVSTGVDETSLQPIRVLSIDILKGELEALHRPWIDEFSAKLEDAVSKLAAYVDTQMSQVVARVDDLEKRHHDAQGPEVWMVIQGLPKASDESPTSLRTHVEDLISVINVKAPIE
jgi:hypothetical protein